MKRVENPAWQALGTAALLVVTGVAMTLAAAAVGATWNAVIGALR